MSVTKLKTVGNWQGSGWQVPVDHPSPIRGRVITGMLSGGGSLLQSTVEPAPRKTEK
jgi:hypothetical protein